MLQGGLEAAAVQEEEQDVAEQVEKGGCGATEVVVDAMSSITVEILDHRILRLLHIS